MTTPTGGPTRPVHIPPSLRASWARHVEDVTGTPAVDALERCVAAHWQERRRDEPMPDTLTAEYARRVAADTGQEPVEALAALFRDVYVPTMPPEPPVTRATLNKVSREAQQAANAVIRDALAHLPADVADRVVAAVGEAVLASHEAGQHDGWTAYAITHNLPID